MEPGAKHDVVVVFVGPQGGGKTEALRALVPEGMYDSATRVSHKGLEDREFLSKLNSRWIFEFDEIDKILQGRESSEFKGFATRRVDAYVEKYETQTTEHPRRSTVFGTTNHTEFLNDHTGDRRFWVVPVGTCNPAWIRDNRDSIWATVLTWMDWGLTNWLPQGHELVIKAAERAREARICEPWEYLLRDAIEKQVDPEAGVPLDYLLHNVLNLEAKEVTRDVQMRVTRCLTGEGFVTHGGKWAWEQRKRRYWGGSSRSGYMPVPSSAAGSNRDTPVGTEVGSPQTCWHDSVLKGLFQPFQPFGEDYVGKEGGGRDSGEERENVVLSSGYPEIVGTGRNGAETPSGASDLPEPTGSDPDGTLDLPRMERPPAAAADRPQVGAAATVFRPGLGNHKAVVHSVTATEVHLQLPDGTVLARSLSEHGRLWRLV
jgi:hypothetical protein